VRAELSSPPICPPPTGSSSARCGPRTASICWFQRGAPWHVHHPRQQRPRGTGEDVHAAAVGGGHHHGGSDFGPVVDPGGLPVGCLSILLSAVAIMFARNVKPTHVRRLIAGSAHVLSICRTRAARSCGPYGRGTATCLPKLSLGPGVHLWPPVGAVRLASASLRRAPVHTPSTTSPRATRTTSAATASTGAGVRPLSCKPRTTSRVTWGREGGPGQEPALHVMADAGRR